MKSCLAPDEFEAYRSGVAGGASTRRIREHLDACSDCRTAYELHGKSHASRGEDFAGAAELTQSLAPGEEAAVSLRAARHFPKIEGYRITGVLGQGGMGAIVYRAVQDRLNRTVALLRGDVTRSRSRVDSAPAQKLE